MTPTSSQSDTRAESYDKNTETCTPGSMKCVRTVLARFRTFILAFHIIRFYIFLLTFQWRQFHPNPIFEQKVMIKILESVQTAWPSVRTINCNHLSKIALKASISRLHPDGVVLASGRLHFFCTNTKDSVQTGTPHRPDGLQLSSHICVWYRNPIACRTLNGVRMVLPRLLDGFTWTLDSSWTLNSVRTICHYVWMDAILNSLRFLDTNGRPNGKFSSSGRMLLTDEHPDGNTTSSRRFLGIRLLWVGISTKSSLNTEIAFMKLVTLAICHNTALSTSEK